MSILEAHRQRVAALSDAMTELRRLHDESYALWCQVVALLGRDEEEREHSLEDLHAAAYAHAERIAALREQTFGFVSRAARLRLTGQVESTGTALSAPEAPPAGH